MALHRDIALWTLHNAEWRRNGGASAKLVRLLESLAWASRPATHRGSQHRAHLLAEDLHSHAILLFSFSVALNANTQKRQRATPNEALMRAFTIQLPFMTDVIIFQRGPNKMLHFQPGADLSEPVASGLS